MCIIKLCRAFTFNLKVVGFIIGILKYSLVYILYLSCLWASHISERSSLVRESELICQVVFNTSWNFLPVFRVELRTSFTANCNKYLDVLITFSVQMRDFFCVFQIRCDKFCVSGVLCSIVVHYRNMHLSALETTILHVMGKDTHPLLKVVYLRGQIPLVKQRGMSVSLFLYFILVGIFTQATFIHYW